jgi:ketosteroid isomerase-like protein
MSIDTLARWHELLESRDPAGLDALLDDDVVFLSPVVHSPQRGKALTAAYLGAAMRVLGNESFRYVREIVSGRDAMLEFELEIDGTYLNGVDLIRWGEDGRITEFKVMVRPLQGIKVLHQKMAEALGLA